MATYRNKNDEETIYIPADFKLKIDMTPIGGAHIGGPDSVDFQCTFSTGSKKVVYKKTATKNDFIFGENNEVIALLHSTELGKGTLSVLFEADIPDDDITDADRHEAALIPTNLKIK